MIMSDHLKVRLKAWLFKVLPNIIKFILETI
jgi:hypothetical protein